MKAKLMLAAVAATLLCLGARAANEDKTWMVVDLRTGALSYYGYDLTTATNTFNTPLYKTEKMVFRRIPAGIYYVQGNGPAASGVEAVMVKPYWIGLFQVTQAQWTLMGNPEGSVGDAGEDIRPQANTSWETVRGSSGLSGYGVFPGTSPLTQLNGRTGLTFDLPTEAMWEVACRAADAGAEAFARKDWKYPFHATDDSDLPEYAWCGGSSDDDGFGNTDGRRVPGGKRPNEWGLYDMLGNVWEWCLDGKGADGWSQAPNAATDAYRRTKGGSFNTADFSACRPQTRGEFQYYKSSLQDGFRLSSIDSAVADLPIYSVTWVSDDSTVLETDEAVFAGKMPTYDGSTPTKADDGNGPYYFAGWTPRVAPVVSNTTYTAKFKVGRLINIATITSSGYTAQDGDVFYGVQHNGTRAIGVPDGVTITLAGIDYRDSIHCLGDGTIILEDDTENTIITSNPWPAIDLRNPGKTLTIRGNGKLTVQGGNNCAGIGPCSPDAGWDMGDGGSVVIEGGDITATGGSGGAGIGASSNRNCENITINGGKVTATGGSSACGIGSSSSGTCESMTIEPTVEMVVATGASTPIEANSVAISSSLTQTYSNSNKTLTMEPIVSYFDITWCRDDGIAIDIHYYPIEFQDTMPRKRRI